jgi:transcriptional regulator with XRE-family HTH domain
MTASGNVALSDITPEQSRAARGLLDWSRDRLADASGIPKRTIMRFEGREADPRGSTLAAIRAALEAAGVEFIAENGGGAGVRLVVGTKMDAAKS